MKTFSFNLIPKKDRVIVIKEEKRDNISVYTAFLPLVAVIIWLFLILFNGLVVEKSKQEWTQLLENKQDRIDNEFYAVRLQHGELVTKTRILGALVSKDIKPEVLFILTERIFPVTEPNVRIVGYGRRSDGSFDVNIETDTYSKFAEITRRFSNYQGAQDVTITSVNYAPAQDSVLGTINCYLDVQYIENENR